MAGDISRYLGRQAGLDQRLEVIGPEMLFHRRDAFESGRILFILSRIGNNLTCFLFPLINEFRIACDLDAAAIFLKTHPPAKSLLVQRADYLLKGVIIRRPEQAPGKAAACYGSEIPFNWLLLNDFTCIKVILFLVESDSLQCGRLHRYGTVVAELVEHYAIVQGTDPNPVPFRSLQEHPG